MFTRNFYCHNISNWLRRHFLTSVPVCISGYVINPEEVRPAQRYLIFLRAQKATPPLKPRPLDYLDVAASILVKNRKWFKKILRRDNYGPFPEISTKIVS